MIKIINFIREHDNWEELLSSPPYSLSIKRKDTRILFKYSQINSDFSLEIVREARGLILEDKTWKIVCYPFKKFFNYGEAYANEIDWETAKITSKEDGSLIKIYNYNSEWRVGTNSTIDAEDAVLNSPYYRNFRELFDVAANNCKFDFDRLDPNYTYLMELCSCHNTIVVPYNEPKLFHVGTRNNITCEEEEVDIGIEKPKEWALSSLNDCIAMAATFDFTREGFVCRDKSYHRVKVKSEDYVKTHRMISNGKVSEEKILSLICSGEEGEFLSYFPTYTTIFQNIKIKRDKLKYLFYEIKKEVFSLKEKGMERKDFAQLVKNNDFSFLYFLMYDNSQLNFLDWENKISYKKMVKYYELI